VGSAEILAHLNSGWRWWWWVTRFARVFASAPGQSNGPNWQVRL